MNVDVPYALYASFPIASDALNTQNHVRFPSKIIVHSLLKVGVGRVSRANRKRCGVCVCVCVTHFQMKRERTTITTFAAFVLRCLVPEMKASAF